MAEHIQSWERNLLGLAYEAWPTTTPEIATPNSDKRALQHAYSHCNQVTALHSRSFHLASALLPTAKRQATRALYAFCRITDDIVDRAEADAEAKLRLWRQRSLSWRPPGDDLVAVAWADARARYQIPQRYAEQLIEGVTRDLHQTRYETFEDLTTYCYGVASTVGLMSMHITGFSGPEAIPYAVKLGVALQLTNILRDVGEDWRAGRLYLPQEDLAHFGLTETDIAAGQVDERWRAFVRFQIVRTRRLYAEAQPGIAMLNQDGRLAIAAAAGLYSAILQEIEQLDYDVFSRRAHVSGWSKLRRLPGIWWQSLWLTQEGQSHWSPSPAPLLAQE
jgi:phytoene synthase